MDTDDLSNETYKGVIIEAEKFNHDLTLRFGVLSSSCASEEEYLKNAKMLAKEIRKLDKCDLEDLFFGNLPDISALHKCLQQIELNIAQIQSIPEEQRTYDF